MILVDIAVNTAGPWQRIHLPMREMQEMCFDPLEEEMATHSSILARTVPCTEEPGGL